MALHRFQLNACCHKKEFEKHICAGLRKKWSAALWHRNATNKSYNSRKCQIHARGYARKDICALENGIARSNACHREDLASVSMLLVWTIIARLKNHEFAWHLKNTPSNKSFLTQVGGTPPRLLQSQRIIHLCHQHWPQSVHIIFSMCEHPFLIFAIINICARTYKLSLAFQTIGVHVE